MYSVKIACPTTGKRFEVDIEVGVKGLHMLPPYAKTVACSSCGRSHEWRSLQVIGIVPPLRAA